MLFVFSAHPFPPARSLKIKCLRFGTKHAASVKNTNVNLQCGNNTKTRENTYAFTRRHLGLAQGDSQRIRMLKMKWGYFKPRIENLKTISPEFQNHMG